MVGANCLKISKCTHLQLERYVIQASPFGELGNSSGSAQTLLKFSVEAHPGPVWIRVRD